MSSERVFPEVTTLTAIQAVCAWPNLQITPQGELLACIFNQPCHGKWEGDLDCWASTDAGDTWQFRGRVAAHAPGENRMNCAAGFAANGDLVVICSGWRDRPRHGTPAKAFANYGLTCVYRSADNGRTWACSQDFPLPQNGAQGYIPFGNIRGAADGSLAVALYAKDGADGYACHLLRSRDDGRTWGEPVMLNPAGNETDILHLGAGRWLASSREETTKHVELFRSEDDGRSWTRSGPLTMPWQHTSHLLRLKDGRILLSYGNRCRNNAGVEVRASADEGRTWGAPVRLADTPSADCGYPATAQLADDRLLTAYYTQISGAYHYEMRVAAWQPGLLGK